MEPSNHNNVPSSELPSIPIDVGPSSAEQTTARAEDSSNQAPIDQAALATTSQGLAQSVQQPIQLSASDSTATSADPMSSTLIADDVDLIEKEWIFKAKAIVAQTKDDPYIQNKELSKVKAEYVKKRYDKDLKVSKD